MIIKYLIAGPASALVGVSVFLSMGFGVLPAIGMSWLIGCAAIAALITFQVYSSSVSSHSTNSGVEPVSG